MSRGGVTRNGVPLRYANKEAGYEAIGKPHPQELWHSEWAAGKHGQHPHWSLLYFSIMADDFSLCRCKKGKGFNTIALQRTRKLTNSDTRK
jgi:hypothetical protein